VLHGTQPGDSAYSVQPGTVNLQANAVTMDVLNKNNNVLLALTITALEGSTARSVENVPRPRQRAPARSRAPPLAAVACVFVGAAFFKPVSVWCQPAPQGAD